MLRRFPPLAHRFWILIETLLHGFEHILMLRVTRLRDAGVY
jgi:hypothetical protein